MRTLALILARAGSKGVPGKNRAIVAGRPCCAWTIDDAREAKLVSRVALSTDDTELQRLALQMGVDVVARPAELASDAATVDDAARHAVDSLDGPDPEAVAILYANVPVRPRGLVDRAVATLVETGADSVQSYAPVGKHHPWWTARVDERTGEVAPWEGDQLNHGVHRRQDLPPAFVPDGGVVVVTTRALRLEIPGVDPGPHAFFGRERRGVTTGEGEVVDIDAPRDLALAEAALAERLAGGPIP
jgi:N-acylneuraminate cytidylyltransferase